MVNFLGFLNEQVVLLIHTSYGDCNCEQTTEDTNVCDNHPVFLVPPKHVLGH